MSEVVEAPWHVRVRQVAGEWCGSEAYHPWRRVVLSRTLYYFGGGVFSGYILFFLIDRTDAKDPLSDMSVLAVLALSGSFLAAWPAGLLSDSFGSVACLSRRRYHVCGLRYYSDAYSHRNFVFRRPFLWSRANVLQCGGSGYDYCRAAKSRQARS